MFPLNSAKEYRAVVYALLLQACNRCYSLRKQDLSPHEWVSSVGMVTLQYMCKKFPSAHFMQRKLSSVKVIESNQLQKNQRSEWYQIKLVVDQATRPCLWAQAAESDRERFPRTRCLFKSQHLCWLYLKGALPPPAFRLWCPRFRRISWKQSRAFQ